MGLTNEKFKPNVKLLNNICFIFYNIGNNKFYFINV